MQASTHHECTEEKQRLEKTLKASDAFAENSAQPSIGGER
jgi:hypothetical protein